MAGEISLHQLLQTPFITKVVSQIKTPMSLFQQFFNVLPGSGATETVNGDTVSWDIFNTTRLLAKARSRNAGPSRSREKAVGSVSAKLIRLHDSVPLAQDKIFATRPLGSALGTVDVRGQQYITRQLTYLTQKFRNAREFMISRMLRGGFGVKLNGQDWILVESGDANAMFTVDFQIPAANKDYLELGTGANVIDVSWEDPAADVMGHLYAINRAYERLHGRGLKHIWINSKTFGWLQNNAGLQTIAGSAYRVFESLSRRGMKSADGIPDTGFDVEFRALPLFTFHVYDAVLNIDQEVDSTTAANSSMLVPDNKAIFLPEVDGTWHGWAEGGEIVAENVMDEGKLVHGFHNWKTRTIDPAGWDLKMLDNGLPLLYIPQVVCYGTVGGF